MLCLVRFFFLWGENNKRFEKFNNKKSNEMQPNIRCKEEGKKESNWSPRAC